MTAYHTRSTSALLVIDMQYYQSMQSCKFNSVLSLFQNDFVSTGGSVHIDAGVAIVPNVIKAVEVARGRGILVTWVVREHDPLGRDVELFLLALKYGDLSGITFIIYSRVGHWYGEGKLKPSSKRSKGAELVDGLVIKDEDYKVTVFDAVGLDYKSVTVIVDATAAATPDVHGRYFAVSYSKQEP
ncbi:isochorismatase family protein [Tanacetum coccineum]